MDSDDQIDVITTEPQSDQEIRTNPITKEYQVPVPIPGVPLGLELLHAEEEITIISEDNPDVIQFVILDKYNNRLYTLNYEITGKAGCGNNEQLIHVRLINFLGHEVANGNGGFKTCQKSHLSVGNERMAFGRINTNFVCLGRSYNIKNSIDEVVYKIFGPGPGFCCCSCTASMNYNIFAVPALTDGNKAVGQIHGEDIGQMGSKDFIWHIIFPDGLNARMKFVFLGALLLINNQHELVKQHCCSM